MKTDRALRMIACGVWGGVLGWFVLPQNPILAIMLIPFASVVLFMLPAIREEK